MLSTALNRSLLKPVSVLQKFLGSFGDLTLRNMFPGVRNLCHVHREYFIYVYIYLVFTKSVDSYFRAFWLAPVTRNILGYLLFCERKEKWRIVSWKFQKKKIKTAFFYPSDLVNTKTTIPLRVGEEWWIYTERRTFPSGDSCILCVVLKEKKAIWKWVAGYSEIVPVYLTIRLVTVRSHRKLISRKHMVF